MTATQTRAAPQPASPSMDDSVAVVIPVYNAVAFLRETLDSVYAQTLAPSQIIVVDDGSTDGSGALLEAEPRVTLYRHPNGANKGMGASWRLALKHVTARYVAWLDADDFWYPQKLEHHIARMASDPTLALTYSDGWVVDSVRNRLWPLLTPGHRESNDVNALLLNCYIRNPSSVVARRDVVLAAVAAGALADGLVPCDHDLWLRIAEQHHIAHVDERLVEYRQHGGQLSRNRRQWEQGVRVLEDAARRHRYRRSTLRKRSAVLSFRLGQHDMAHGKRLRALAHLGRAALLDPRRALATLLRGRGGVLDR